MDRRQFLKLSGFITVSTLGASLAACGDSVGIPLPPAGTYSFPQGIASGDPRSNSVVLWTRVTSHSVSGDFPLRVQLSATQDFSQPLVDQPLSATAQFGNTVRHKVQGLQPYQHYYYRFIAGGDVSPTGRTKTAPVAGMAGEPSQVRFAYINCQSWTANHWEAMNLAAAEDDLDFIVNLGDYIYELTIPSGRTEAAHGPLTLPNGSSFLIPGTTTQVPYAVTLNDYRYLYQTYRSDPRLLNLHALFPMISVWDDHEFSDDCWLDHETYDEAQTAEPQRRCDATQAWFEYMPVDMDDVQYDPSSTGFQNISIYRDFSFGSLVDLVITDQRLFREAHPIPPSAVPPPTNFLAKGSRYLMEKSMLDAYDDQLTAQNGRPPSVLGVTQTEWLKQRLSTSTAAWKIWGSEVTFLKINVPLPDPATPGATTEYVVYGDSWEGYPGSKKDITTYIGANKISNVVSISGDIHAFLAGVVMDDQDAPNPQPVMTDFVSAGISSSSFYSSLLSLFLPVAPALAPLVVQTQPNGSTKNVWDASVQAYNPEIAHADCDSIGYVSVTVTKDQFAAVFNKVNPVVTQGALPSPILNSRTQLTLNNGSFSIAVTPLSS
ncbi:alkaline phosphatase D family protein [Paraburkholderia bryophila]|uniref:alkaline phosphatase D family protein n=1 Tax=Burkholderiaceae TaxID=119060 RepID=UPI000552EB43|nr:alkaline phosphatase D family protein [Burkholderia sp. 9120]